ncbi:carbohydrate kinase family protein [Paenibacillus cremeus]|uniref:carbohydrate kinase family protein n=1 Tax=Paenibacillus cremeus TaxID=2163881 RepID=UPI001645200D|nr:carbohydrate kinase family protein [Paenibacillus cremeus]
MIKADVLAIGELNVDLIISGLTSMPELDREIIAKQASLALGSSTAICACGISKLDFKTAFIGKVGNDEYGKFVVDTLAAYKIDTSNIIVDSSVETGMTISLGYNNDRALITVLGSIDKLQGRDINFYAIKHLRHIHVGSFFLQSSLRKDLADIFRLAQENGISTSLDPGWDHSGTWDYGLKDVLRYTSIFLPNEQEALHISGCNSVEKAAEALSEFAETVAIKRGKDGCTVCSSSKLYTHESFLVENVVDTTGAGDSFNAGFIYGYLHNYTVEQCMRYGCACGAICVQQVGGATGCPTIGEVNDFLRNHS